MEVSIAIGKRAVPSNLMATVDLAPIEQVSAPAFNARVLTFADFPPPLVPQQFHTAIVVLY